MEPPCGGLWGSTRNGQGRRTPGACEMPNDNSLNAINAVVSITSKHKERETHEIIE
jgi:hypothetical protein